MSRRRMGGVRRHARRALGLLLATLVLVPVFGVLDAPGTGVPGRQAVRVATERWVSSWPGIAACLVGGFLLAWGLRRRGGPLGWLERAGRALAAAPTGRFALSLGVLSALLCGWCALAVLDGRTVLNDASVQLVQARYFAAGRLAGPPLEAPQFWSVQFMVDTPAGWVAQYPPGHALMLATGVWAGVPWAVGPLVMAAVAVLFTLAAERLLPGRRAEARLAGALVAVAPFLIGLAASYMSHATAALLATAALYCALRSVGGSAAWAAGAGAAAGALVATRPLSGVLIGSVATLGVWAWPPGPARRPSRAGWARRLGAAALGALPVAAGFAAFNAHFFGHPLRLGYLAAAGPRHGLGFHVDPWGRFYGPVEAVGYASAELVALGRDLLGSPIPLVLVVGLWLALARRIERGEALLAAWAVLPVLGSALYWHHDFVLGPRMLGEAAPAWCALAALAAVGLVRSARTARRRRDATDGGGGRRAGEPSPPGRGRAWLGAHGGAQLLAGAWIATFGYGILFAAPKGLLELRSLVGAPPVVDPPDPGEPALVFVHEAWSDRLGARLAARGLRLDSVRTLLRRHPPCVLQAALDGLPPGPAAEARCAREARSDRRGWLGLTELLWQGDLPGLPPGGAMWVRDLGPEANATLLSRYPERVPLLLLPPEDGAPDEGGTADAIDRADGWALVPYGKGVEILWGEPARTAEEPATPP